MKTQIFVMTHKKFDVPQDEIYVPLHVGRALAEDLGYLGDDTGDSISEQNRYYGELTGLYWLWKNYHDVDIIGICHYRRYFVDGQRNFLTKEGYEKALENADILVSEARYAEGSYIDYYGEAHNVEDLLAAGGVIREQYPSDYPAFCQALEESKYYYGNLCVTTKKLFDEYCEWLFSIFFELQKRVDVSSYDSYHQRLFGFLSEELLRVFILARKLKVAEGNIGLTAEKAETVELKLAMSQLVKMGQFSEARELFYGFLKMRPDVRLELSDVRREIPDIELILYILEQETERNSQGFYSVSHDLKELITHIRTVRGILGNQIARGTLTAAEQQYLVEKHVTDIAKEIIRINM